MAGDIDVVFTGNSANFSATVDKMIAQTKRASDESEKFGHTHVSSMQAASASTRLLLDPMSANIRAVERLLSQSELLSKVMVAAFPVVGTVALLASLVKVGKELKDFVDKLNDVPKALQKGFGDINSATKLTNDALDVTNDKLAIEISKLEKKPENRVKLSIDEMIESADKLSKSLSDDIAKVDELLSKNKSGMFDKVLTGQEDTKDATKFVQDTQGKIDAIRTEYADVLNGAQAGGASKDNIVAIKQAEMARLEKVYKDAHDHISPILKSLQDDQYDHDRSGGGLGHDQRKNINIYAGFDQDLSGQEHRIGGDYLQETQQSTVNTDTDRNKNAQLAAAAQKAADQKRLDQYTDSLSEFEQTHKKDVAYEYQYWKDLTNAFASGSDAFNKVADNATAARYASADQAGSEIARHIAEVKAMPTQLQGDEASEHGSEVFAKANTKDAVDANAGLADANALSIVKARNNADVESARIQDADSASMTRAAAAAALAAVHTKEYVTQLSALKAMADLASDALQADPTNKGTQKANEEAQANLDNAARSRAIQMQQDHEAQFGRTTSGLVGFNDALDNFVKSTQDNAAVIGQITTQALQSLNAQIINGLSGQKTDFRGAASGIARNVAGAGLNKLEGQALGAFGIGKPDGSASKPWYVKMADSLGGKANDPISQGIGAIKNLFGGGGAAAGNSSGMSSLLAAVTGSMGGGEALDDASPLISLISTLPMLATGGPLSMNTMAIVGENGPELFMPSTSGHVIPNSVTAGLGGGGMNQTIHVDARGATDPAQVRAQVAKGISAAAPQLTARSMKAQSEQRKRGPSMASR